MTTALNPQQATRPGSDAALVIDKLVKNYKPSAEFARTHPQDLTEGGLYRAVKGVDLHINPGEVTVLLGANGAGKTTTLACAQGLIKPDSGTVSLLGHNPWQAGPDLRAQVGIMLQDGGLPQSMRPLPLLHHIARMYSNPLDVDALARRLGIDTFNGTTIRRLSGGQKQRVAFAAAILGRPRIVFLDEPTAGLDPQSRAVVFDIIRELRQQGVAIVLTTHLLDDAQRIADRVYIMDHGTVLLSGTLPEVLAAGANNHQTLTFTCPPGLTLGHLYPTPQASGLTLTETSPGNYQLTGPLTPQHLADLTAHWAQEGTMPTRLTLTPRTLEDIFLELSGSTL